MPWRALAGLAMIAAAPAGAASPPVSVASMNQCADQIVLALVPRARITSVSWLARDPEESLFAARARTVPINHGTAEEIVRQKPGLVVVGRYTTPATQALLKRLGYRMLVLDQADSWDDIRRVTRQVAAATGETARGEALIARMDARLAALARDRLPPVRVAAWDGVGFGAPPGSLFDAELTAAGAINVAGQPPASGYTAPDAEVLLVSRPALLIEGAAGFHPDSLGGNHARHPLVERIWRDRTISVPPAWYACGTPYAADAAAMLRTMLRAKTDVVRTPLVIAK